jgi:hypothetical protein
LPEAFPLGAALRFTEPVPFDEEQIAKIAPAVPLGGCLGVSMTDENFSIWGFVRARPSSIMMTVTVDVSEPGIVRVAVGPFSPYSVLDGRSNPVISGNPTSFASHVQQALHKELSPTDVWETQAV